MTAALEACFYVSEKGAKSTNFEGSKLTKSADQDSLKIILEMLEYFNKAHKGVLKPDPHEKLALKICINCGSTYEQLESVLKVFAELKSAAELASAQNGTSSSGPSMSVQNSVCFKPTKSSKDLSTEEKTLSTADR